MIDKHLDKINLNDLEQLRSSAVLEGKTIEYKKLLPTNSDGTVEVVGNYIPPQPRTIPAKAGVFFDSASLSLKLVRGLIDMKSVF